MADLPRWVATGRVDSAAMFGAFLQHLHEIPLGRERDALLSLPAVDHRAGGFWGEVATPVQPSANPTVLCQVAHCVRCSEGRGGYVFRWFKTEWSRNYVRGARGGSWRPGEEERPVLGDLSLAMDAGGRFVLGPGVSAVVSFPGRVRRAYGCR